MIMPLRLGAIAAMLATLALAGCSYTPARIHSEPLIEIDDDYGSHRHGRDDRHYRHRDYRDHHYHDRDHRAYGDDRPDRYRHPRDDHRRGGFCPPGLEMQGRC